MILHLLLPYNYQIRPLDCLGPPQYRTWTEIDLYSPGDTGEQDFYQLPTQVPAKTVSMSEFWSLESDHKRQTQGA